jgi:hypothetical protein
MMSYHRILKKVTNRMRYNRITIIKKDFSNVVKFGFDAPKFAERIWINPNSVILALKNQNLKLATGLLDNKYYTSGKVIYAKNLFRYATPISSEKKIVACIRHFEDGLSWENTGIYEYLLERLNKKLSIDKNSNVDGCRNFDEIVERYRTLDVIFNQMRIEGRMKTMSEMIPNSFREMGGIRIHVGPEGEFYFGGGGHHRFGIAYALRFKLIPVSLGFIHRDALPLLFQLRKGELDPIS